MRLFHFIRINVPRQFLFLRFPLVIYSNDDGDIHLLGFRLNEFIKQTKPEETAAVCSIKKKRKKLRMPFPLPLAIIRRANKLTKHGTIKWDKTEIAMVVIPITLFSSSVSVFVLFFFCLNHHFGDVTHQDDAFLFCVCLCCG